MPLAHPSTLDHPPWALERGWWSHCSWRVPIEAWMSAEFFINVRREV